MELLFAFTYPLHKNCFHTANFMMSRSPPSDTELNKMMGKVTDKQVQDLIAATEQPYDQADLDTLSKMAAMFGPSDKCSNE
jgi:arsenate reductase-like glutaredoxin family protein